VGSSWAEPEMPNAASPKAAIVNGALVPIAVPANIRAIPPISSGTTKCHTRSPVRSELCENRIIPRIPASAGTAVQ